MLLKTKVEAYNYHEHKDNLVSMTSTLQQLHCTSRTTSSTSASAALLPTCYIAGDAAAATIAMVILVKYT